jgi:hypothetical protein
MSPGNETEERERAEELYVYDFLSLQQISGITGIALDRLERWSSQEEWSAKRKEHSGLCREIRRNKLLLQKELIRKALDTLDPKTVSAAHKWLGKEDFRPRGLNAPDIDRPALFIEYFRFIAESVKELDPEGLKVLARNFDAIIARFKEQHAKTSPNHGKPIR